MASSSTSSPVATGASATHLDRERVNYIRVLLILDQVAWKAMEKVFHFGAPDKIETETIKEYLQRVKGMSNTRYREVFNRTSREKIEGDPSCKEFDISLWLPVIENGCNDLARAGSSTWHASPDSLENHIKRIKDARNDILHLRFSIPNVDFFPEVEYIRKLVEETIELAFAKYDRSNQTAMNDFIDESNTLINVLRDEPLTPIDFEAYDNILLTMELENILKDTGVRDLKELFNRMSNISPASVIAGTNIRLKVKNIFTELEIVKQCQQEGVHEEAENIHVAFTDILEYSHTVKTQDENNLGFVILIEGIAGVGKTTLLKMLMSSWVSDDNHFKELDQYKFVIHTDCRDNTVSSFADLVSLQMPIAKKHFQSKDHMKTILVNLPLLILIDGIDEMNPASKQLFQEIMGLKKFDKVTMICTTRPEKVKDYYSMIPAYIHTLHLKIKGIPEKYIKKFVFSYYCQLKGDNSSQSDPEALLYYLRTTGACLKDHWRIPLNLTLLTLLWIKDHQLINSVTTATELYKQIHRLTVEKLIQSLDQRKEILGLDKLSIYIEVFIAALCKEALLGLRDDAIILREEAVQRLKQLCCLLRLPHKEVLGTFLTQENIWQTTSLTIKSCFRHKWLQEFYAAYFVYVCTTGSVVQPESLEMVEEITEGIMNCIADYNLPPHLCHDIVEITSARLTRFYQMNPDTGATIKGSLELALGEQLNSCALAKFQGVFVQLAGLFYECDEKVSESLSEELIQLLSASGIGENKDAWIHVLNTVKCDHHMAELIANIPNVFSKRIEVSDVNVFAYATLLTVIRPKEVSIVIKACPLRIPRLDELLRSITDQRCIVKELSLEYFFHKMTPSVGGTPLEHDIIQLMKRCKLEKYKGCITASMELPKTMQVLFVSVLDVTAYQALHRFLKTKPSLITLRVCVNKEIEAADLHPMPESYTLVYVPDVLNEEDILKTESILKRLQPTEGKKQFTNILFPRCSLDTDGQQRIIMRLFGVHIKYAVCFPANQYLPTLEQREHLKHLAKDILHCEKGVIWGGYGLHGWEE